MARGIAALAHESCFFVTSAVQRLVAGDPAFELSMMGPAALVGGPTISLFRVSAASFMEAEDVVQGVYEGRT